MSEKLFLKGINGLRAIAAISVLAFHLNMSFQKFNLPNLSTIDLAGYGVTIFFAISGFLITYLLLKEKEGGEIDIKKFYIRRVLRIWPLYFLVLIISIITGLIFKIGHVDNNVWYYILLSANIPFILDLTLPFLGHYWSLGVEEQFYLFWPWIIKVKKHFEKWVLGFTVFYFLLRLIARFIEYKYGHGLFYTVIHVTRFDCMAIGALGAVVVCKNKAILLNVITHPVLQILSWLVILLLMFNQFHILSVIDQEIVSCVTVVLIINMAFNPKPLLHLNYKPFEFLGKISYGIYMVHQLVIFFMSLLLKNFTINSSVKYILIYVSVVSSTIIIAHLSYNYFEKYFLRLKEKYSVV